MADPTKYVPGYSYSGYQAVNPSRPLPAAQVDNDLAEVQNSIGETIDALKGVRRSDGDLQNKIVTYDSLADDVRALLPSDAGDLLERVEEILAELEALEAALATGNQPIEYTSVGVTLAGTPFTVPEYVPGQHMIFPHYNGSYMTVGEDFTETSTTTIAFTNDLPDGAEVRGHVQMRTLVPVADSGSLPTELIQFKANSFSLGFDNGTTDTSIFTGADKAPQGYTQVTIDGVKKGLVLQRTAGTSLDTDERHRIVELNLTEDGTVISVAAVTGELQLGHQGLTANIEGGNVYLYSQAITAASHTGVDAGRGFTRTRYRGASTTQADVTSYQLFGYAGSGHALEALHGATPCVSSDGRWLILLAKITDPGVEVDGYIVETVEASNSVMVRYLLSEVLAAADPLTVSPDGMVEIQSPDRGDGLQYCQGLSADGPNGVVYIARGYYIPLGRHVVQRFDMFTGADLGEIQFDGTRGLYTWAQLLGSAGWVLSSPEFEGVYYDPVDKYLACLVLDNARTIGSVVTYQSQSQTAYATTTAGTDPANGLYWTPTTAASGGAYSDAAVYGPGNYVRKDRHIIYLRAPTGDAAEMPLTQGRTLPDSGASVVSRPNALDTSARYGDQYWAGFYAQPLRLNIKAFGFRSGNHLEIRDISVGSDWTKGAEISPNFSTGREYVSLYSTVSGLATGSYYRGYGIADSTYPGIAVLASGAVGADPGGTTLAVTPKRHAYVGALAVDRASTDTEGGTLNIAGDMTVTTAQPAIAIRQRAVTTADGSTAPPQAAIQTVWEEGTQDLGTGEGQAWHWFVKLIADGAKVLVGTFGLAKANNTDTDRTSDAVLHLSVDGTTTPREVLRITGAGGVVTTTGDGIGYATGAGGPVTQGTSRTTGVTLNKASGGITLFTAAGSATPASFTVTNSKVAATDTINLSVKSGTNVYLAMVTAVAAGSFQITFWTTGGTASDAPVINFTLIKGVAA